MAVLYYEHACMLVWLCLKLVAPLCVDGGALLRVVSNVPNFPCCCVLQRNCGEWLLKCVGGGPPVSGE
jgi:hypothetical protein